MLHVDPSRAADAAQRILSLSRDHVRLIEIGFPITIGDILIRQPRLPQRAFSSRRPGWDACICWDNGKIIEIGLNGDLPEWDARFAHAAIIGHAVLHHPASGFGRIEWDKLDIDNEERPAEAAIFASHILVPQHWLEFALTMTKDELRLTEMFEVPLEIMEQRLAQFRRLS